MTKERLLNNLRYYWKQGWSFVEACIVVTLAGALALLITLASFAVVAIPAILVIKLCVWLWKIL